MPSNRRPSSATPAPKAAGSGRRRRRLVKLHRDQEPAVGTFYAQAKPGAPPYVSVGVRVTPTTVVCLIEAMKIFNEITGRLQRRHPEVLVKNQESVEFGTVLFRVDPNA